MNPIKIDLPELGMRRINVVPYHGAWQAVYERTASENPEHVPVHKPVYARFFDNMSKAEVEMPIQAPTFGECQDILIAYLNGAADPFSFARCRQVRNVEVVVDGDMISKSIEKHLPKNFKLTANGGSR